MNEDRPAKQEDHRVEHYEDEIELIDILRVIWKWKYLIIGGTVVCGLLAAIISFNMSKIHSIDMVLRPGVMTIIDQEQNIIGEQGQKIYIDSPSNIKALINSGTFNNNILNYLYEIKMKDIPKKLEFKLSMPKDSDTITVTYETANIKQGEIILDRLSKLLLKEYDKSIQHFKNEYDMQLIAIKHEIGSMKANIQSYKRNIKNILIKNNTTNLIAESNKFLSKNPKEDDGLQILFYIYLSQQNIRLSNDYLNEINDYKIKKEEQLQKIHTLEYEIEIKLNKIKSIQFKKDNIQNIQILQSANSGPYPIKPRISLNVILALVTGLFFMLFLAFLLEYIRRNKRKKQVNIQGVR